MASPGTGSAGEPRPPATPKQVYPYRFGEVGALAGVLTREQIRAALMEQQRIISSGSHEKVGEIFVRQGALKADQVPKILTAQAKLRKQQEEESKTKLAPAKQDTSTKVTVGTRKPGSSNTVKASADAATPPATTISNRPPAGGSGFNKPPATSTNNRPPAGGSGFNKPPATATNNRPPAGGSGFNKPPATATATNSTSNRPPAGGSGVNKPPTTSTSNRPPAGGSGFNKPPANSTSNRPPAGGSGFNKPPAVPAPAALPSLPSVNPDASGSTGGRQPPKLGQFELLRQVGEGSMGAVFEARDTANQNRIVALKILPKQLASDPEFLERFRREVKTARTLDHPNIVAYFDAGRAGTYWYLSLEFVDGVTLTQKMEKAGRFPEMDALRIARDTARGLSHAHQLGLVHRDIKPDNIMITSDGMVKLTDFGLAKKQDDSSGLTAVGMSIGTPYYLSPEQAIGKQDIDHRADLYSLGVTLFQLVTGKLPFEHQAAAEVMVMHLKTPPPDPRSLVPSLSRTTSHLILKLLEKEPADRFYTAEELIGIIDRILSGEQPDIGYGRKGPPTKGINLKPQRSAMNNRSVGKARPKGCLSQIGLVVFFTVGLWYLFTAL